MWIFFLVHIFLTVMYFLLLNVFNDVGYLHWVGVFKHYFIIG